MLKLVNTTNANYEIEILENNEFLIEFYTNQDVRCCMSLFYNQAGDFIYKKHIENIDFLITEEIEHVHEYFYNELETEIKKVCNLMLKL